MADDVESIQEENETFRKNKILLATALERNDLKLVQSLLESSQIDANLTLLNGKTLLVEAISLDNGKIVDVLIKYGADPRLPCTPHVAAGWTESQNETSGLKQIFPLEQSLKQIPKLNEGIIKCLLLSGAEPRDFGSNNLIIIESLISKSDHPEILMDFLLLKLEKESSSTSAFKNQISNLLVTAVKNHKIEVVNVLLNQGANANHRVAGDNLPVLVIAANKNNLEMCEVLVKAGAVLNHLSYIEDVLPLTCAVDSGLITAVDVLIKLGAEVNVCPHHHANKTSLVHVAVSKQSFRILSLLLKAGAAIRAVGKEGNSPLHIACRDGSDLHEYLSLLLSKIPPADNVLEHKNTRGQTALMVAVQNLNVECARFMIKAGSDVNAVDGNGESVLHQSVRVGNDQLVEMLLKAGADPNRGRSMGCTPLLSAVWQGDDTLTQMLLESGADPKAVREMCQESALHLAVSAHLAVSSQKPEVLQLLLETGKIDINARTESGDTPLMLAARGSCPDTCRLLVEHGANLDLTDYNQEETALSLAVYFGKEVNACLLIKEGANIDIADHTGLTPIYWAFFNCRVKTLTFLVYAGAKLTLHQLKHSYPCNLSTMRNKTLVDWVTDFLKKPRKLQDLCRLKIRRRLSKVAGGKQIASLTQKLPLPDRLIKYIKYDSDELPNLTEDTGPGE